MVRQWLCRDRRLTFEEPLIMGVMNITPDSFSDGGTLYRSSSVMLEHALTQGATMMLTVREYWMWAASPVVRALNRLAMPKKSAELIQ